MSASAGYLKKGSGAKYIKNRPYTANSAKRVNLDLDEKVKNLIKYFIFRLFHLFQFNHCRRTLLYLSPVFHENVIKLIEKFP